MPQIKLKSVIYGVSLFLIFPTFLCLSEITKGQSNPIPADDPKVDNVEKEEFKTVSDSIDFRVDIGNEDESSWWGGHIILKDNNLYKTKNHDGIPLNDASQSVKLDDFGKLMQEAREIKRTISDVMSNSTIDDIYNLGIKNGVDIIQTVQDDGKYNNHAKGFEGEHIYKVDGKISDKLNELTKLLFKGTLRHSYPHSWRSKAPLIYRNTPQWFISMEKKQLRDKALKSIDETIFYPAQGQTRLRSMIETRPDWCISRQRVWGVPLPLFVSKETGQPLRDQEVIDRIADIYEKEGSDTWFTEDPQRFLGDKYSIDDFEQVKDVVEVWFDSGSTHAFCLEKREDLKWPASMYLEGSDQHRGWFHSSLLESSGTRGRAPYESVLTHGFVVDGKGRKMSKSLGNVISPDDILKKYGVDILRLWVVASDYYDDLKLDNAILQAQTDSYRRIRNTFRYIIGNLDGFGNSEKIDESEFPDLEQYILHRLWEIDQIISDCVKNFNFHLMFTTLLNFCSNDLSAFYFDLSLIHI